MKKAYCKMICGIICYTHEEHESRKKTAVGRQTPNSVLPSILSQEASDTPWEIFSPHTKQAILQQQPPVGHSLI
jgi:hypothetical protein